MHMEICHALVLLLLRACRSYGFQTIFISLIVIIFLVGVTKLDALFIFIITTAIFLMLLYGSLKLMDVLWSKRNHYARIAKDQGIQGPEPSFLWGNALQWKRFRDKLNIEDRLRMESDLKANHVHQPLNLSHKLTLQRILPEHVAWSHDYGVNWNYLMWFGPSPQIVSTDMEVVRDALLMPTSTFMHGNNNNEVFSPSMAMLAMGKPTFIQSFLEPLGGPNTIAIVNGDTWAHRRGMLAPVFHSLRLKEFSQTMVNLTKALAESWCRDIEQHESGGGEIEIEMQQSMADLSADIIARTQFRNNHERWMKVFHYFEELRDCISEHGHLLMIPGMRYVPLPSITKIRNLKRIVDNLIQEIVEDQKLSIGRVQEGIIESSSYRFDLLDLMFNEGENLTIQEIVDECKTIFIAGHETTSVLLTWALLLLAHNTHWQDKARSELVEIYSQNLSDFDTASKMRIVEMILYEALRLFPPGSSVFREALCDLKLGELFVAKGMTITIPIVAIHLDPQLWGDNVYEFDPGRFSKGIRKASKHPMAFLPFAHGPRNCLGQLFAMLEAKLVLGTLLSKFSFAPSPSYRHAPTSMFTIRPKYGAPIIVKRIVLQ